MKNTEKINFRDRKLVFVDLETTGLDCDIHEVIEIGCLVVDGRSWVIEKEYYAKVKPLNLQHADDEALKISGYNSEDWGNAREFEEVLREFVRLAPKGMIAGWKVDFDWSFLRRGFKKYNIEHDYDYHIIDVAALAYGSFAKKNAPERLSLGSVSNLLGVPIHPRHSEGEGHGAMLDIKATYDVFRKLMDYYAGLGVKEDEL